MILMLCMRKKRKGRESRLLDWLRDQKSFRDRSDSEEEEEGEGHSTDCSADLWLITLVNFRAQPDIEEGRRWGGGKGA